MLSFDLAAKYQIYIVEDDYLGDFLDPKLGQTFHYLTSYLFGHLYQIFSTSISSHFESALILPNVILKMLLVYKIFLTMITPYLKALSLY